MISRLVFAALIAAALIVAPEGASPPASPEKTATVSLSGRVLGAEDIAVSGATIRILPEHTERPEPRIVTTAEDGTFNVDDLAGESFTVRVEAQGYASFTQPEIPAITITPWACVKLKVKEQQSP